MGEVFLEKTCSHKVLRPACKHVQWTEENGLVNSLVNIKPLMYTGQLYDYTLCNINYRPLWNLLNKFTIRWSRRSNHCAAESRCSLKALSFTSIWATHFFKQEFFGGFFALTRGACKKIGCCWWKAWERGAIRCLTKGWIIKAEESHGTTTK